MSLHNDINQLETQFGSDSQAMLETFVAEVKGLLDDTDDLLMDSDDQIKNQEFNRLMRNLHTLKGISAQSGLHGLSRLIHQVEDSLVPFKGQDLIDLSGGSPLFVTWVDRFRQFIGAVNPKASPDRLDGVWNEIEKASQLLTEALKNPASADPLKRGESLAKGALPGEESQGEAQRSLGYNLEKNQFDHLLKLLEGVLAKLFRHGSDPKTNEVIKMVQESLFSLINARTSPGRSLSNKIKRLAKDTATALGKDVEFQAVGFDTRIDNNLLQGLSESLGHMIKNGIDHGIEGPDERKQTGKNLRAALVLEYQKRGDRSLVTLKDDGKGINPDLLTKRALEKGLITLDQANRMTTYEKQELIFKPGFSTKAEATEISGRGVGMDAVVHQVQRLGGKLTFDSKVGVGTTFFMEFPAPYQFESMTLFRYGRQTFAIPARLVKGLILDADLVTLEFGTVGLKVSGDTYTLICLRDIDPTGNLDLFRPLILLELSGAPCALMVDQYCGTSSAFVLPTLNGEESLPVYLRGACSDPQWGVIFCIDCVELERNLNMYIPAPDEEPKPISKSEDLNMLKFAPLVGRKTSRKEILETVDGAPFLQKMAMLLEPLRGDPSSCETVITFVSAEVDEVKGAISSVDDEDELQYLLAISYTYLKSKWILYNTKMNYMLEKGVDPKPLDIYLASSLTHLLDLIEPLTNPEAVRAITMTLGQTFRELSTKAA